MSTNAASPSPPLFRLCPLINLCCAFLSSVPFVFNFFPLFTTDFPNFSHCIAILRMQMSFSYFFYQWLITHPCLNAPVHSTTVTPPPPPREKIRAKSVPGQVVNLPGSKYLTSETSAANRRTPETNLRTFP